MLKVFKLTPGTTQTMEYQCLEGCGVGKPEELDLTGVQFGNGCSGGCYLWEPKILFLPHGQRPLGESPSFWMGPWSDPAEVYFDALNDLILIIK